MLTATRWGGTGIDASGATARQIFQSVGGGVFALTDSPEFLLVDVIRSTNSPFFRAKDSGTGHSLAYISRLTGTGTIYAQMWIGKSAGGVQTETISLNGETGEIITLGNITGVDIAATGNITLPVLSGTTAGHLKQGATRILFTTSSAVFLGPSAGNTATTGNYNVGVGITALDAVSSGQQNVGVGRDALGALTTGSFNVAVGSVCLSAITGASNMFAMGALAMQNTTGGGNSVAIGTQAAQNSVAPTDCVFIGASAGKTTGTISDSVAIGVGAGDQCGSGCVMIGRSAGALETGNNKFYLDNSNTTAPLLHGDFAADTLRCNGTFSSGNGNAVATFDPTATVYAISTTQNETVYRTTVNTTANTVTTLATIPIAASYTYLIESRVTARRTGGSAGTAEDCASYVRRATYKTVAGTVTLVGAVQTIGTDVEDQAGWDCTLDISGTNVRVRVTGATNNNITWNASTRVQRVNS